jgi:hypothetical protein
MFLLRLSLIVMVTIFVGCLVVVVSIAHSVLLSTSTAAGVTLADKKPSVVVFILPNWCMVRIRHLACFAKTGYLARLFPRARLRL